MELEVLRKFRDGRRTFVECVCHCGKFFITRLDGDARSCGCLQKQAVQRTGFANRTHGKCRTRTYMAWCNMLNRCRNPKVAAYYRYGARGITVTERWNDFAIFLADMGEVPTGYSIERKNNDGHYEPDNCLWIPKSEQAQKQEQHTIFCASW